MSDAIIVNVLDQLKPFLNDKKVLEIVVRGKNKRIKTFQKVALSDLTETEEKALLEKAVHALNKNNTANDRNMKLIADMAKKENIGILLNGMNLCATCAGFAVMYEKLDSISEKIGRQLMQLQNVVTQGNDVQTGYEFNKVLADHTDMLDCRRKQQPYTEEKMRELVDQEYNVLTLLINVFKREISADNKELIISMFSLLAMLTDAIKYFDEIYYENNHDVLGDENVWHTSHEKWMGVYGVLRERWFIEKLQDYGMFESELNMQEADIFCTELLDQVVIDRKEVEDNQTMILALGDIGVLHSLHEVTAQEIKDTIREAFEEGCSEDDKEAVKSVYEKALKQAAMA